MSAVTPPAAPASGFWSIERVVAALSPVFAAVSGGIATEIGKNLPGISIPKNDLIVLFTAGALAGLGAAVTWLRGRSKWTADVQHWAAVAQHDLRLIENNPVTGQAATDLKDLFDAHTAAIVDAIGKAVGAPVSVDDVVKEVVSRLQGSAPAAASPAAASGSAPAG